MLGKVFFGLFSNFVLPRQSFYLIYGAEHYSKGQLLQEKTLTVQYDRVGVNCGAQVLCFVQFVLCSYKHCCRNYCVHP